MSAPSRAHRTISLRSMQNSVRSFPWASRIVPRAAMEAAQARSSSCSGSMCRRAILKAEATVDHMATVPRPYASAFLLLVIGLDDDVLLDVG